MNTKQVIIMRKDLKNTEGHKVKSGKLVAQGAHAAMGCVKDMMEEKIITNYKGEKLYTEYTLRVEPDSVLEDWWEGAFTKITLGCDTLQELFDLQKKAKAAKLPVVIITDAGRTEFGGKPTVTCIAIGPAESKDIDKITGHLKPY
jgi:peptidyl-tRNA hydrolase, PTH2 family